MKYRLPGKCLTTAMAIMPHTDLEAAMDIALSMDVPFWPQLPKMRYHEDMYAQSSEKFPGLTIHTEEERITFQRDQFYEELPRHFEQCESPGYYELSEEYSIAFQDFMSRDLSGFQCIRGQSVGPVSFGVKITDEDRRPIIYDDEIRPFMFEFMANKANAQYRQLKKKNDTALVWMDEPGLQMLFASFTGYTASAAARDYADYMELLEGPRGIHLCGNPDWSFLLRDVAPDVLSMDSYSVGHVFTRYKEEVVDFLKSGSIIAWGITPTLTEELSAETFSSLVARLEEMFDYIAACGIDKDELLDRSWLAPSRCCLVNPDRTRSVEQSFQLLREIAEYFKTKYHLD